VPHPVDAQTELTMTEVRHHAKLAIVTAKLAAEVQLPALRVTTAII
jgi:hypothetical protein